MDSADRVVALLIVCATLIYLADKFIEAGVFSCQ